jgi:hypothetical protein
MKNHSICQIRLSILFGCLFCAVFLFSANIGFAQKKRTSKPPQSEVDSLAAEKDVFQIVRIKDTLTHSDGTMFKLGMYIRPVDSIIYKTRDAMMVIFNSREGRYMVYRDVGRRLDNNWYTGRVYRLMKPAIRATGTKTEASGVFERPHPIPEAWNTTVFKYLFFNAISPRRLLVLDSLVMLAPGYNMNDSNYFFIRVYESGNRYEHRFRTTTGGFVIDPVAFGKAINKEPKGEMTPGELLFKHSDGTEELIAGVMFVFPDIESIQKELRLIAKAIQTEEDLPAKERNKRRETAEQKKNRIRQELYEHLQTLFGSMDSITFKKFLQPFKL